MTTTEYLPTLLTKIKDDIGAVGKDDVNTQQHFNFRGIDAVINAVAPVLIKHGVTVLPKVKRFDYGSVEVGRNRTPMGHARVIVQYTFVGPAGDRLKFSAPGEAMDSGDKATAKAMSVAYRTALLQALSLPTTEMDPDALTYQRTDTGDLQVAVAQVQAAWATAHGGELDIDALAQDFYARPGYGGNIRQADAETLRNYAREPLGTPVAPPPSTQDQLQRATDDTPQDVTA